jgi:orotidine-5'-phosphate decarboxylase
MISLDERSTFHDRLRSAWTSTRSALCVGLDPDAARYPLPLTSDPDRVYTFCRAIVDATAPHCAAFKPQIAYFAAQGAEVALERLCTYILSTYPAHVLVLDAKRGDIGPTATQYAREAFERYGAHVVTVNPYMGTDSIEPYLDWSDRGVFVLCRTSNPGGDDLQALPVGGTGRPLYEHVADLAVNRWNSTGQVGLVVGATYPAELATVRGIVGDMPLLVPGVGAQGGDAGETVRNGSDSTGFGMLVNSSRAILYASSGPDFAEAAAAAAAATTTSLRPS